MARITTFCMFPCHLTFPLVACFYIFFFFLPAFSFIQRNHRKGGNSKIFFHILFRLNRIVHQVRKDDDSCYHQNAKHSAQHRVLSDRGARLMGRYVCCFYNIHCFDIHNIAYMGRGRFTDCIRNFHCHNRIAVRHRNGDHSGVCGCAHGNLTA